MDAAIKRLGLQGPVDHLSEHIVVKGALAAWSELVVQTQLQFQIGRAHV